MMSSGTSRVTLRGSHRVPKRHAHVISPVHPAERIEVTVRVRPRNPLPDPASRVGQPPMSHDEFAARHGADPDDLKAVADFAARHGLVVVESSVPRRQVMLSGTPDAYRQAFGVEVNHYAYPEGTYRGREGSITIPAEMGGIIEGVFGLETRPVARPHIQAHRKRKKKQPTPPPDAPPPAAPAALEVTQVAQLYNFPAGLDGTGQVIGIIELGGGYLPADLQAFFGNLGLPTPTVLPVSVDQGVNRPDGGGASVEVTLDIEVAGAVAPGATIVVYFTPDASAQSFLDAITQAVHDTQNNPSVISISWGGPESVPEDDFMTQFDQALQAAALLGITVCVAAGDNGAADEPPSQWDGSAHVDFPASSPNVLACGGTYLQVASGAIADETAWNDQTTAQDSFSATGGGVSDAFPLPSYQQSANVPASLNSGKVGRGVPDVCGNADPNSGYDIIVTVNGEQQTVPVGGTSAVAPLWAGLIARINQKLGRRVGLVNPTLYGLGASTGAFHDITSGNNRVGQGNLGYDAGPGWDPCTGLGSPDGTALLTALSGSGAGTPSGRDGAGAPARPAVGMARK